MKIEDAAIEPGRRPSDVDMGAVVGCERGSTKEPRKPPEPLSDPVMFCGQFSLDAEACRSLDWLDNSHTRPLLFARIVGPCCLRWSILRLLAQKI